MGTDFGVSRIVVHPVLSGANVPLGEDSCKVRIRLLDTVQHGSARHILEGRFEVKSNKDSGGVSFRVLERNLYGHPLAGLLWERKFEKILLKECLFVHREKRIILICVCG